MSPLLLIDQLRQELRPYPFTCPFEIPSSLLVLLLLNDVGKHVGPIFAEHVNLVFIFIVVALLNYKVRGVIFSFARPCILSFQETFTFLLSLSVGEISAKRLFHLLLNDRVVLELLNDALYLTERYLNRCLLWVISHVSCAVSFLVSGSSGFLLFEVSSCLLTDIGLPINVKLCHYYTCSACL
jgi:hypothetical protein